MAKAPQKSKEAKAKAAQGSSKKSKKKWSKGKSRDKLQNLCLFDKPTYDRLMKEVPKYKVNDLGWPEWFLMLASYYDPALTVGLPSFTCFQSPYVMAETIWINC